MRNCPLLFLLIFSCSYFGLFADSKIVLPFKIGEKLEYDLSWGFFPVGEATMEVHSLEKIDGELCYLIRFSVRTNSFADNFYKVRTKVESFVSYDFRKSIRYRKVQEEGKTSLATIFEETPQIKEDTIHLFIENKALEDEFLARQMNFLEV